MLPLFAFLYFLVRLSLVTTGLWWFLARFAIDNVPTVLVPHLGKVSASIAFLVLFIDSSILYPKFRSPLRHLPPVKADRELGIVTEMPRGKTPLRWARENPDADIVHVTGGLFMPETVCVQSPAALRDLMSTSTYDFVKPDGLRHFLASVIGYGLITTEGDVHKRQRKSLIPAFNVKHIRALYPVMWEQAGILIEQIGKDDAKNGSIEVSAWASRLALDIIGVAALSRNFRSLTEEEHPVAKAFEAVLEPEPHMVAFLGLNLLLPVSLTRLLPMKANRTLKVNSRYLRSFCTELLEDQQKVQYARASKEKARGQDHESEHAILSKIIESGEFTNDELIDQMLTFIAAGHETTGSSISWALHLLTLPENKHYQKIIRDEIRQALPAPNGTDKADFSPENTPAWSEFESMPYLNGLCEEILRLFPAVPITLRESIRPTRLASAPLPASTLVIVPMWAVNRNPKFWGPDSESLKPERWVDTLPDGSLRANKHGGAESNYCEITFLHGQRACIGRDFAKAELRCVMAGILGRFEVARLPGDNGNVQITGAVTTKPRGGLKVKLTAVPGW